MSTSTGQGTTRQGTTGQGTTGQVTTYGGDEIITFVADHEQEWVFGVTGSNSTSMYTAMQGRPVKYLQATYEAAALSMADGYARVRGEATCLMYMAPGAVNSLNSLYSAWKDETPVLVVMSDTDSRVKNGTATLLEADLPSITAPFTRVSRTVPGGAPLREWLERAYRNTVGAPQGPAVLAVGQDILEGPAVPTPTHAIPAPHREPAMPEDVSAVTAALRTARHPLLVAGGQLRRLGGAQILQQLSERFAIPVAHDVPFVDRLAIAPWHPHFTGYVDLDPVARSRAEEADVVVLVGSTYLCNDHPEPGRHFFPNASFVAHVNADPGRLDESQLAHWTSCAGPRGFLQAVYDALAADPTDEDLVAARRTALAAAQALRPAAAADPIVRASAPLFDALEHGWVVDESTVSSWRLLAALDRGDPGRWVTASSASLGWGPAAACGVALGSGGPVTCTIGDGALRFGMPALWTAQAFKLPITFFVYDNRGYGSTEMFASMLAQERGRPASFIGSDYRQYDRGIADLLTGFGIPTVSVGLDDDIRSAVEKAWAGAGDGPNAVVVDTGDGPHPPPEVQQGR